MDGSAYVLKIRIPLEVRVEDQVLSREDFYSWLWEEFLTRGLQGVHEGTLLTEAAAEEGLEAQAWTLDSGEAPRDRDWMAHQKLAEAELYFASETQAREAVRALEIYPELKFLALTEQKSEDWDAQWKASFLANPGGVQVPPCWRILPPWTTAEEAKLEEGEIILRINPGAGFGTGTHETTQLCLSGIGERARTRPFHGQRVLDFGSGSGILAIAAALVGGKVIGVEIDPLAIDNANENAEINGVKGSIEYLRDLDSATGVYPVVIANILKPVLLEFAPELVKRMEPQATLILSGLIESDVEAVSERYSILLSGRKPERKERGEWRALIWDLK
jgi:ribosomal protein L11 methyltransferase